MKVTEKGQVTIPKDLRDALGIGAGTEVEFERRKDAIVVRKSDRGPSREPSRRTPQGPRTFTCGPPGTMFG